MNDFPVPGHTGAGTISSKPGLGLSFSDSSEKRDGRHHRLPSALRSPMLPSERSSDDCQDDSWLCRGAQERGPIVEDPCRHFTVLARVMVYQKAAGTRRRPLPLFRQSCVCAKPLARRFLAVGSLALIGATGWKGGTLVLDSRKELDPQESTPGGQHLLGTSRVVLSPDDSSR